MKTFEVIIGHSGKAGLSFDTGLCTASDVQGVLNQIELKQGERVIGICETPNINEPCFTQLPYGVSK